MLKNDINIYNNEIYPLKVMISNKDNEDEPILLSRLYNFFSLNRFKIVLSVLDRKNNDVSLRLLDWLVTNYAKKHNISYEILGKNSNFNIYISYKSQLKAYSKKQFDPFCRRQRIIFTLGGTSLSTTIGQLNFFRWAISNNVIDYAKDNIKKIENDMLMSIKKSTIKKKRSELSVCAVKSFTCTSNKTLVHFD
tara:strand:- start:144 stop:722 length:579 start_codon:yes stop_codon:yes gene_type:complete